MERRGWEEDRMHAAEKRLNEMNRLGDMLHFPVAVNAGATANVLLTLAATWWVAARYPTLPGVWMAAVLVVNLVPVAVLRTTLRPETLYPRLREMNFFHDQHKFSDWVYVAASADMAFWVLLGWTVATLHRTQAGLAGLMILAGVCTFSPVLARVLVSPRRTTTRPFSGSKDSL